MKIHKLVERELTELEQFTIDKAWYYLDGAKSFALIGEGAFVILSEENTSVESMKEEALSNIDEVLSYHPDFLPQLMDDQRIVVLMNSGVTGFTMNQLTEDDYERENMPYLRVFVAARNNCLMACERAEILAIVVKD